jgi:hypothetical protein
MWGINNKKKNNDIRTTPPTKTGTRKFTIRKQSQTAQNPYKSIR